MTFIKRLNLYLRKDVTLIYTMGKVGSTAVEGWLPNAVHVHTLYGNPPSRFKQELKFGKILFHLRKWVHYPVRRLLIKSSANLTIITILRHPDERNLSMFFHDLPYFIMEYEKKSKLSYRKSNFSLLDVYENFDKEYPDYWLNSEFCKFTGVTPSQILQLKDNPLKLHQKNMTLYIAKLDQLDTLKKILQEQFEITDDEGIGNKAKDKWYQDLYTGKLSYELKLIKSSNTTLRKIFCDD